MSTHKPKQFNAGDYVSIDDTYDSGPERGVLIQEQPNGMWAVALDKGLTDACDPNDFTLCSLLSRKPSMKDCTCPENGLSDPNCPLNAKLLVDTHKNKVTNGHGERRSDMEETTWVWDQGVATCLHRWETYTGLFEAYEHCKDCGAKKKGGRGQ